MSLRAVARAIAVAAGILASAGCQTADGDRNSFVPQQGLDLATLNLCLRSVPRKDHRHYHANKRSKTLHDLSQPPMDAGFPMERSRLFQ